MKARFKTMHASRSDYHALIHKLFDTVTCTFQKSTFNFRNFTVKEIFKGVWIATIQLNEHCVWCIQVPEDIINPAHNCGTL